MKQKIGFIKGVNVLKGQIVKQTGGAGTSYVALNVPARVMVTDVLIHITEAWAGGTSLDLGDLGDTDGFLANANLTKTLDAWSGGDCSVRGAYLLNGLRKWYASATNLLYTIVGTYTTGKAEVYVAFVKLE